MTLWTAMPHLQQHGGAAVWEGRAPCCQGIILSCSTARSQATTGCQHGNPKSLHLSWPGVGCHRNGLQLLSPMGATGLPPKSLHAQCWASQPVSLHRVHI